MLLAVEQYFFCKNSEPSPAGTAASDRTTDPSQEFGASATATPSARADAGGALTAKSDRPASMVDEVATVSRIAHAGFTARGAVLRAWMRAALSDGPSTKRNIRETREVIGSIQNGQGHDQSFEEGNERCDSALPSNQRRTLPNRRLTMYSKKPSGSFMHHPATTGDTHTDIGSAVRLRLRDRRWRSSLQMLSP